MLLITTLAGLTDMSKNAISKPVFFGIAAKDFKDFVTFANLAKKAMEPLCPRLKVFDFDADHWIPFAAPDELNAELHAWIDEEVRA